MMGRPLTLDQLRQDVGLMVERITHVTMMLQRSQLRMEEYVCLKVIAMLSQRESTLLFARPNETILTIQSINSQGQWNRRARVHSGAVHAVLAELRRAPLSTIARAIF